MTTIAPTTKTKHDSSPWLGWRCNVELSEAQQIILNIEQYESLWVNNAWTERKTGVTEKYRLEGLCYSTSHGTNKDAQLESLCVRGFRKDGGLKYREDFLYRVSKEVLEQIPDKYHNIARKQFALDMKKLQKQLTEITNNGLQIGKVNGIHKIKL